ncbi:MAG: 30S ribosomal protein S5 [Candidatus Pacebacteria bacterium]|nr:30S ribosomal protein S5 [Candidatus Paceibacterota bacterium]
MTEEKEIKKNKVNNKQKDVEVVGGKNKTKALKPKASEKDIKQKKPFSNNSGKNGAAVRKPFKKNFHPRRRRPLRPRSEFDQKIIKIRRVTRVVAGGRRFSFSVAMVLGNHKGSVGVAVAKAADTALAIEKAVRTAKKNLIKLKLTAANSIPYDVSAKYCSSIVEIIPAKKGKGLSAGSSVKNVLELAGITDVTAKIKTRSKNKLNIAMATLRALEDFK